MQFDLNVIAPKLSILAHVLRPAVAEMSHASDAMRPLNAMGELVGHEVLHDVIRHRVNVL
jgi:hypothetical protein